jgi:Velvet factor
MFIQYPTQTEEQPFIYNPNYFLYASLIGADTEEEYHLLRDGKTRSTAGSIVSSLFRLKDTEGREGAFFVFPDLSVRREGNYRLKVS